MARSSAAFASKDFWPGLSPHSGLLASGCRGLDNSAGASAPCRVPLGESSLRRKAYCVCYKFGLTSDFRQSPQVIFRLLDTTDPVRTGSIAEMVDGALSRNTRHRSGSLFPIGLESSSLQESSSLSPVKMTYGPVKMTKSVR